MRSLTALAIAIAVVLFAVDVPSQCPLLQDDFNDNSLDPAKWYTVTTGIPGNPSVKEQNLRLEMVSRGHLVTFRQFDPNLYGQVKVTGKWTFISANSGDEFLEVLTRSDAIPSGRYGETQNGLHFRLRLSVNYLEIYPEGSLITVGTVTQSGNINFRTGQTYDFEVVDAGSTATFKVWNAGRTSFSLATIPILSDQTTTKHVVFHNREGNNTSALDDVVISGPSASYTTFGVGCPGAGGMPALSANTGPKLCQTFNPTISNVGALQGGILFLGASNKTWQGTPLPLALGGFSMPGCTLYISLDVNLPFVTDPSGAKAVPIPIPCVGILAGSSFYLQAFVRDPGANPIGVIVTNAGQATIGC